ncbi:MAG: NADP-dependent oxidoreductase [Chlamydiales bacterium]|nr:NADP-dependent oxidoreductase [Chlamydiia bacterium]MCP5508747.1 NADP-dependent oxidoreductase [Chlamydiales bacterium]
MEAYVIEDFNGIESIKTADIPKPVPQANEVLIKLACSSVNPVDWKISEGLIKSLLPHKFPITLGWDGAGTVDSVGKNVTQFKPGDKVFAYCRKDTVHDGTFTEFIAVDAKAVAPMPKTINFAEAASLPLTGLTAWQSLFDFGDLKSGETIYVIGGAGGVGSLAIQLAKHAGAKVITTASAGNHAYVKKLGADIAIDYNTQNVIEEIRKIAPDGVDFIYDCAGGVSHDEAWEALKDGGRFVSIVRGPDKEKAAKKKAKAGFVFVQPDGNELAAIGDLIDKGIVKVPAIHEMPLKNVKEALKKNKQGHTQGKIVLTVTK